MADALEDVPFTIHVYRVNPETGARTKPRLVAKGASKVPMLSSQWPLCECFKCRDKRR